MLHAFTLIELLVVITVIGILIAVIGLVGVKVVHQQKVTLTETTMRTVKLAIDQFKEVNPLANIYDRKDAATFGPYPPYRITNTNPVPPVDTVFKAVEPAVPLWPWRLTERLLRDLNVTNVNAVLLDPNDAKNDDIRAMYAYLRVFVPDALAQVPKSALKPLTAMQELVNPSGGPAATTDNRTLDVFGIYDAWGVPLDYFLYVKLEYTLLPSGSAGWRVAERIPALRSHGISLEEYVAGVVEDSQVWIFSDPFPSPPANRASSTFKTDGVLPVPGNTLQNGWARVQAAGDTYGYVP